MLLLLASLAHAHPFALRVAAHEADVVLAPDGLRVLYRVDVPVHGDPARADLQDPEVLATGVVVEVDGEMLPLRVAHRAEGWVGHVHTTKLTLAADVEAPEHVEVSVGNYPDLPGYFTWRFAVDRRLEVTDASLLREGAAAEGRRVVGDAGRTVDVSLAPAGGSAWRALTPEAPATRPLEQAVAPAISEVLLGGRVAPWLLPLGAALGGALGAVAPRRPAVALLPVLAAPLSLWLGAQDPHLGGFAGALAGMLALVAVGWEPAVAPAAATAAVAVAWTLGAPGPAAVVAVAFALGQVATRGASGAVPATAAVGALLALLRAWGPALSG